MPIEGEEGETNDRCARHDVDETVRFGLLDVLCDEPALGRDVRVAAGAELFRAGDVSDALFVIDSGLVDVVAVDGGRVATFGSGETVGEVGVLTGRARSATARAQTEVVARRVPLPELLTLMASRPGVAEAVARMLAERLDVAARASLGARGRTVVVHGPAAIVGPCVGPLADDCARLLGERPHVIAVGAPSGWERTRLAASAILDAPAAAAEAVRLVRSSALVLVAVAGDVPAELEGADRRHALATLPSRAARERLAREMCGRRVGVALGSGGVRGFAHAGALRVLVEEGIPIDAMSGASAGAIAAALLLTGWSPADLADLGRAVKETLGTGILPGVPLSPQALLTGRRLRSFFRKRFGETRMEDLDTPLAVAATDLDTRAPVHLTSGSLADAVAASAAVPGVFPSVRLEGRRLVDGGVSDPVPVEVLRSGMADVVVAVNVMPIGRGPMGVYAPRGRIPMPAALEALFVGLDTVATQLAARACARADVVIEPGAAEPKWYEVVPAKTFEQAGARAATDALARLRGLVGG